MTSELPQGLCTGSVLLDIGDDAGTLILRTGPERLGEEIEITRADVDVQWHVHSAVLRRETGGAAAYAAVLTGLPAGTYRVPAGAGDHAWTTVRVDGGVVTDLDLRKTQER